MALLHEGSLLPTGRHMTFINTPLEDALRYFRDFRSQPKQLINELPLHHIELGQVKVASWAELLLMQNYQPRYLVIGCADPEWTALIGGITQDSSLPNNGWHGHEQVVPQKYQTWGSPGLSAASYLRGPGMPHEHSPIEVFGIEMRITHLDPIEINTREFGFGTYLLCAIAPYQQSRAYDTYPRGGLDSGSSVYIAHASFGHHGLKVFYQDSIALPGQFSNDNPNISIPDGEAVYEHFNHRIVQGWAQQRGIRVFDEDFYSGPAHLFVPYHPDHGYQEQQPRISFEDFQRFQCVNPSYNQWLCEQGLF